MATRFYFTRTILATFPISDSGQWDQNVYSTPYTIKTISQGPVSNKSMSYDDEISETTNWDVCLGAFVSNPLAAQTIEGTVKAQIFGAEDSGSMNAYASIYIRVVDSSGNLRGTLLAYTVDDTEFDSTDPADGTTYENRTVLAGASLSSVGAQQNDRICVEVGYRAVNTKSTLWEAGLCVSYDSADTDAPEDNTTDDATAYNSWIEFSQDLTWYIPAAWVPKVIFIG